MLNMLVTAVRLGLMKIENVPPAFLDEVKAKLGIEDPVEEVAPEPTAPAEAEENTSLNE